MGEKVIFVLFSCFVLILSNTTPVLANIYMPSGSFEIWSCDRSTVFRWVPSPNYGMSHAGVYQNGELIYTIQNLRTSDIFINNIIISQDFQNVMFIPSRYNIRHKYPSGQVSYVAMEFYTLGELVKTHNITDFIRDMNRVSRFITDEMWLTPIPGTRSLTEHIREYDILRVMTVERIVFELDLTTGKVLSYRYYDPSLMESDVTIMIHGNKIEFYDQRPVILNERLFVPVRDIFEPLGFIVEWNTNVRYVHIRDTYETFSISMSIDVPLFSVMTFDHEDASFIGFSRTLYVPAQIINGRAMMPLRAILESLGYRLDWDEATNTVFITYCTDGGTTPFDIRFRSHEV